MKALNFFVVPKTEDCDGFPTRFSVASISFWVRIWKTRPTKYEETIGSMCTETTNGVVGGESGFPDT